MNTIKFAIIGCGNIAPFHAEAIKNIDSAELTAVCDLDKDRAEKLGEQYSVEAFSDFSVMLEKADVDVVNICLPSALHEKCTIEAAHAGKHIIVEKPLDITIEKCDNIIAACELNNVKLAVIYQNRFKKAVSMVENAINEGRFGKLTLADAQVKWYRSQEYYDSADWRGTWEFDGGGTLMNQSIHFIDILQSLMGPVKSISAKCATLAKNIEVEDTAVAILQFENGALGVIEGTTAAYPGMFGRIGIHGSKGSAVIEGEAITYWEFEDKQSGDENVVSSFTLKSSGGDNDPNSNFSHEGHKLQIEDMVKAIHKNRKPKIDGCEGRKAVEIIKTIYRSSNENSSSIEL
jgi:predicted dehydrogenase